VAPRPKAGGVAPYHHGNLRHALIAEGRRALEEIGVHELGLRYLARMVGVSEAAPSRHFAGKEGLLAAIAADGFRELAARRAEILTSADDNLTKTYRMMRTYLEFARRHKGLFNLMIGPRLLARDGYPELAEESSKSFRLFSTCVEKLALEYGWEESTLPLVTHAAWSTEHGLAMLIVSDRVPRSDFPIVVEDMIQYSISLFLSAVTGGPSRLKDLIARLRV
jgi:AcrR family transcriptional regulator